MADHKTGYRNARRMRGFERASQLVSRRVRSAGESRGFAVTRLLTHWADIVGPEIASAALPVEINYGRGFGATLTLLTTGAQAPMLEMQKDDIREKVNACYGYKAVQKIRITQTASTGFAEGRVAFDPAPNPPSRQDAAIPPAAEQAASGVSDDNLRQALERLGANVLSRTKH